MASALKLDGVRQTVDGAELAVRIDFVDVEDITADQLDVHIDDHAVSLAVAGAAPVLLRLLVPVRSAGATSRFSRTGRSLELRADVLLPAAEGVAVASVRSRRAAGRPSGAAS